MTPAQAAWLKEFDAELKRRASIDVKDAGMTEEDAISRWSDLPAREAVAVYIEKYELTDLDVEPYLR